MLGGIRQTAKTEGVQQQLPLEGKPGTKMVNRSGPWKKEYKNKNEKKTPLKYSSETDVPHGLSGVYSCWFYSSALHFSPLLKKALSA